METLKEAGVMPEAVRKIMQPSYDAILYSAIDVLEPRNNIAVWKLSLSNSQTNANKENRLIDAYIGADAWSKYMGLGSPQPYESDNPLLETTPYFKKYVFPGMGEERTIVTVGFYEGINELFLKISR